MWVHEQSVSKQSHNGVTEGWADKSSFSFLREQQILHSPRAPHCIMRGELIKCLDEMSETEQKMLKSPQCAWEQRHRGKKKRKVKREFDQTKFLPSFLDISPCQSDVATLRSTLDESRFVLCRLSLITQIKFWRYDYWQETNLTKQEILIKTCSEQLFANFPCSINWAYRKCDTGLPAGTGNILHAIVLCKKLALT